MTAAELDEIEYEIVRQSFFYSKERCESLNKKIDLEKNWDKLHDPYSDKDWLEEQHHLSCLITYNEFKANDVVKTILCNYDLYTYGPCLNEFESSLGKNDDRLEEHDLHRYPQGWIRNTQYFKDLSYWCYMHCVNHLNDKYVYAHPRTRDKIIQICQEMLFGSEG